MSFSYAQPRFMLILLSVFAGVGLGPLMLGTQNNDRPIVSTQETWFSDDLQEVVYQKLTNPRNGETVHRLDKIDQGEPNPMLFQPPLDYKVVDEESSFTITVRRP